MEFEKKTVVEIKLSTQFSYFCFQSAKMYRPVSGKEMQSARNYL